MYLFVQLFIYCTFLHSLVVSAPSSDNAKDYDGYQLYRVNITDKPIFKRMEKLYVEGEYDFWNAPRQGSASDIMVAPEKITKFQTHMNETKTPYEILMSNIKQFVDYEKSEKSAFATGFMSWRSYQTLDTIYSWMDDMSISYPSLVTVFSIGRTSEGRPLKVMKISQGGVGKPAVWIDGGIHAREWVAPATASYIANELITKSNALLNTFDWYIMPVMNPDGYHYSHTTERMWRKTRSGSGSCRGVDPNRNWDYAWGGKGTSGNPCSDIYCCEH